MTWKKRIIAFVLLTICFVLIEFAFEGTGKAFKTILIQGVKALLITLLMEFLARKRKNT